MITYIIIIVSVIAISIILSIYKQKDDIYDPTYMPDYDDLYYPSYSPNIKPCCNDDNVTYLDVDCGLITDVNACRMESCCGWINERCSCICEEC